MMKVVYRAFDLNISAPGSGALNVSQAQAKIMGDSNGAVFMFNGDWMLNEVKLDYRNKLKDLEWIYAEIDGGSTGQAFLGSQGDEWDAQKDMLLDTLGGALAAFIFYMQNRRSR